MIRQTLKVVFRICKSMILIVGVLSFLMIVLSFTDYPYNAYHWLGTEKSEIVETPDYIVVMGAGAIPGENGLMRCYYAAKAARRFEKAEIIIALPFDEENWLNSNAYKMHEEIKIRGIDKHRFIFESEGTNTYGQAGEIYKLLKDKEDNKLLIITSPEHMHRSILTFEKCGFSHVAGLPTFEDSYKDDLLLTKKERGQKTVKAHRNLSLRYNMWSYLNYEILILREIIALGWYKLNGYI